jgi:hypothetical protein
VPNVGEKFFREILEENAYGPQGCRSNIVDGEFIHGCPVLDHRSFYVIFGLAADGPRTVEAEFATTAELERECSTLVESHPQGQRDGI